MSEIRLYSLEAEQAVIGALLIDPLCADRLGSLKPGHCYDESHQHLLGEIMAMIADGKTVDAVTVSERMVERGLDEVTGGLAYLGQLVMNTSGSRNVTHYAKVIVDKSMERELLYASDEIRDVVGGLGSTKEKLSKAQSVVMAITEAMETKTPKVLRDVLKRSVEIMERRANGQDGGLATGFEKLDRLLCGGLRPGNLVIVAGRPAMGKTALAVNIAFQMTKKHNLASLVLSMEMPEQELADRLIAQAGSVALSDVLSGNLHGETGERIMSAVSQLHDLPIVIDDQGGLSMFDITSKARSVKRKHGLGLLVIDYLQLMSGDGDNRNQEIEGITRGLKALAKELDIPIVALSQLSRKCEERTNKRPMASDLRESGAIEQDADVILMVYRDEVYHPETNDKGIAEIGVVKNRNGSTGIAHLGYQGQFTRFVNLAHDWTPAPAEERKPRKRGFGD